MKRQALSTSPAELIELAMELHNQGKENNLSLEQKYLAAIINKTGASDDWEFEKC